MKDKVILITGGSGSLGRALIPQLLVYNPHSIRILSNNEYEIYSISQEINDIRVRPLIGDIRDRERMNRAVNGVDYIIHAAALKHVDLCEYNPIEAVKTNILGSINIIDCAIDKGVAKVLAISSDKAVHPINIYGATKLAMEKLFVNAGVYGTTKFSCIRFGNFLGSRGSFLEMVEGNHDAPIPITNENMTRFWIPLEKAAEFTIKCLMMMKGGEVFIPKMDEEKIVDFVVGRPIEIIGRRAGEKLSEMLFAEGEVVEDCKEYFLVK